MVYGFDAFSVVTRLLPSEQSFYFRAKKGVSIPTRNAEIRQSLIYRVVSETEVQHWRPAVFPTAFVRHNARYRRIEVDSFARMPLKGGGSISCPGMLGFALIKFYFDNLEGLICSVTMCLPLHRSGCRPV